MADPDFDLDRHLHRIDLGGRQGCVGAPLRQLPVVDLGISVSAGPAFAGSIGTENRYG